MSDKKIYALNKISSVVAEIDADLLDHPVLGKNFVQVDEPGECIDCGEQPDTVTTADGEEVSLGEPGDQDEKPAKPARTKPKGDK